MPSNGVRTARGLPDDAGPLLLGVARSAIRHALGLPVAPPDARPAWALEPGASFVTLTEDGALRGCIGSLSAERPLVDDVEENAVAAATNDPRFPALTRGELEDVAIEVSVLAPPAPLRATSLAEAREALRPGVDGVIARFGRWQRATFLPQVWDDLPDPDDFLGHLWLKAGVEPGTWPDGTALETYAVRAWHEDA